MTQKKNKRNKVWWQLKDAKCPQCSAPLEKGMLGGEYVSCANNCGFVIKDDVRDLLIKRDNSND